MTDSYKTIQKSTEEILFKDKGSKFYATAFPLSDPEEMNEILNELNKTHPKAGHHCYAWKIGAGEDHYRANDDGEPRNSAGAPIYGQIQSFELSVFEENYLSKLKDASFEIVTMWHVLEHVYHLNDRVKEINRLLKNGGYAIIAVPNCNSYDAKFYKKHWAAYDVPRHLYHFKKQDIKTLFEKHNFQLVNTLPMKFDSYYVSMLSEKYKKASFGLFKAFVVGFISNLKANVNKGLGYSSQIYILKKTK